jgi:DNA-binding Lrp family transcriptional regulator
MDHTDKKIIALLQKDSRLSNKDIGERVHLSGQAVGNRISQLIERNVIKNFTISLNYENTQYIRLFMTDAAFMAVEQAVNQFEEITSFDKVSGQACYVIVAHFTLEGLHEFIEIISKWACYSVETTLVDKICKTENEL